MHETHAYQAIHTALEREIHPTQVTVQIETPEEEWGLRYDFLRFKSHCDVKCVSWPRFINMLSGIQTLLLIGKCVSIFFSITPKCEMSLLLQREFPVVGFIHNHLVAGIIVKQF